MARILVVEDSPTQAQEVQFVLEPEGFEVVLAREAGEGLRLLGAGAFDLVISDIVMPGLTGYEFCRQVKADRDTKDVPVILLTTLGDPMDIIQGLECGADNFVTKPFEPEILLERIRSLLEGRRLRAAVEPGAGVDILFLGKRFTITSDRAQILDLLVATFEDTVRTGRRLQASRAELAKANARVEEYARKLECRVRLSEEKCLNFMESANDAILILDPAGRILEANRQAVALLGVPRAEIVDRPYPDFVDPGQQGAQRAWLDRALALGSLQAEDVHLRNAKGEMISCDLSASVVSTGDERLVFYVVRDVTERNRLARQFHQAQKMEAVGRLAGGIAHDFNNLLTVIKGYTVMVIADLPGNEEAVSRLTEVRKASDRAAALTRQLLAFSRKQIIAPRVLGLNGVIPDLENMLRRLIGEDIELVTVLARDLGRVMADPTQVEQVLMNLVINSRDAMPEGGMITIETANVDLRSEGLRGRTGISPGPHVLLAVSDTGMGMDEATQALIFEPFFTTKEEGKGTGLGLATVYGIVKQCGGDILVTSEPGHGTTFRIYLPRVYAAAEAAAGGGPGDPVVGGTETVLVVEDNDALRVMACSVLRGHGYRVIEARHPDEGLAAGGAEGAAVDFLLTDVVMPGMSGRTMAARLGTTCPGMKVLFMSGYTDASVVHHGVLAQESHFLQKPFSPDALARCVREILDGGRKAVHA